MARPSKDETLIKANPKASPYELLKLGLSEKKYQELLDAEAKPKPEPKNVKEAEKIEVKQSEVASVVEKLIPEIKPSPRAVPKLQPFIAGPQREQAKVKSPNGKVTPMMRKNAEKFVRKNPDHKIID